MSRVSKFLSILILCILIEQFINPIALAYAEADFSLKLSKKQHAAISMIIKKEIRRGKIPGAVVLIGNKEKILYRQAFGYRAVKPEKLPMQLNTIFDIASLTKVVATTTAIMQLSEKNKYRRPRCEILA
jgi:CubicO group peptidase (beta-lactamase class C family)